MFGTPLPALATVLVRALVVAAPFLLVLPLPAAQTSGRLRVTVTLLDAAQQVTPVARHVLLVSDNPASTVPRRLVTAADGTASVTLPPGNYTVESDRPVAFLGKEYQWTQTLDVVAGRNAVLDLTAANAEIGEITAASDVPAVRPADPSDVLTAWQSSVVALWTPTRRASGVVIDARGLIATNQQVVGTATSVEVQLTPTRKVLARVLAADAVNDAAILWVDAAAVAAARPAALGCAPAMKVALTNGQQVVALGTPAGRQPRSTTGTLSRVTGRAMLADFSLDDDATGGPVFAAAGTLIGLTSFLGEKEGDPRRESRVVRLDAVCEVLAQAEPALAVTPPPSPARLPIEPAQVVPADVLEGIVKRRAGSLSPVTATSTGFDLAFLTPVQVYARPGSMDFANWSDYVADTPSVLLVRVTPKQVERLWTTVARGVARTQGLALPPITSFKPGFARLRAFCGAAEVTPIHPFLLERRVSETDAIYEGLYAFDPDALGPHCDGVRLDLFSSKEPDKADPAIIPPKVLQQIHDDFASYRALQPRVVAP